MVADSEELCRITESATKIHLAHEARRYERLPQADKVPGFPPLSQLGRVNPFAQGSCWTPESEFSMSIVCGPSQLHIFWKYTTAYPVAFIKTHYRESKMVQM